MDKRWLVTIENGEIKTVEYTGNRFAVSPKGTKAKYYRKLRHFISTETIPDSRYIVWAQDELGAFMEVMKMQRGERGNPFKGGLFDEGAD